MSLSYERDRGRITEPVAYARSRPFTVPHRLSILWQPSSYEFFAHTTIAPGNLDLKIRFSVAKYSFRDKSSRLTEPVTSARGRTHLLFLMLPFILLWRRWCECFYQTGNMDRGRR